MVLELLVIVCKEVLFLAMAVQMYVFSWKSFEFKPGLLLRNFFVVYFLALFGDWLQGPYVYKLYSYYGYPESQVSKLTSFI